MPRCSEKNLKESVDDIAAILVKVTSAKRTMNRDCSQTSVLRQNSNSVRQEEEEEELDGGGYRILDAQNLGMIGIWIGQRQMSRLEKTPIHTSILPGANYLQEVLQSSSPHRVREALRMPLSTFQQLCTRLAVGGYLRDSARVSVEEQVAIFMRIVGKKSSNRDTQDRFQHSGQTISR